MKKYTIALDVGGTKILSGLVIGNKVSKTNKTPSGAHESRDILLNNIMAAIERLNPKGAAKICIGIAGQIDAARKILLQSPNFALDTKHLPLKLLLEKKFKRPVYLENDANCFTLGEAVYGAGKQSKITVGLTLGTGVGGGIVFDSRSLIHGGKEPALRSSAKRSEGWVDKTIFRGENGVSGEFGHMIIEKDGEYCSCRKRGHFEAYIGGCSISAQYEKLTGKKLFFDEIWARVEHDLNAKKVIQVAQKYLALLFVNIMHAVNPEIIVVGGGLGSNEAFWYPATISAKQQIFFKGLDETKIVPAALGENAALLGASLLK